MAKDDTVRVKHPWPVEAEPIVIDGEFKRLPSPTTKPLPPTVRTKGNLMDTRYVNTIALFTGGASCAFALWIVIILGGIALGAVPLWLIERIATYSGVIALVYVLSQLPHPRTAMRAANANFKVDRYTSYLPLLAVIAFVIVFGRFVPAPVSDVWLMIGEYALAIFADFLIFGMAIKARKLIETGGHL